MAATISLYNHGPKLFANKELDFTKFKFELLTNSASYNASHTSKAQVDSSSTATVTLAVASPGVVGWTAHGFSAGKPVMFKSTVALPTGLTAYTWYYVQAGGLTADSFRVSAIIGGSDINFTGSQSGVHTGYSGGAYEVFGNGWPVGGLSLANVTVSIAAISDATANDAKLSADDLTQTASGGSIGPSYKGLIYEQITQYSIAFIDFGGVQTAGDTTDFKVRWNANGIINWTM